MASNRVIEWICWEAFGWRLVVGRKMVVVEWWHHGVFTLVRVAVVGMRHCRLVTESSTVSEVSDSTPCLVHLHLSVAQVVPMGVTVAVPPVVYDSVFVVTQTMSETMANVMSSAVSNTVANIVSNSVPKAVAKTKSIPMANPEAMSKTNFMSTAVP